MPDWLLNLELWDVVLAAFFGTLGLIGLVAVPIWLSRRNQKRLGFEVLSNAPVIGPSIVDPNEWDIQYKGTPLIDPYLMEVQLENIGRVPIQPQDYESGRPIKISSTNGGLFMAISQQTTYPGELSLKPELDMDEIRVSPLLLNPGEGFRLTLVTVGKCVPEPSARIAGLDKGIEGMPTRRAWWDGIRWVFMPSAVVVVATVGILSRGQPLPDWVAFLILGLLVASSVLWISLVAEILLNILSTRWHILDRDNTG